MKRLSSLLFALWLSVPHAGIALAGPDEDIAYLQTRWAEVNYQLEGKARLAAFEQLVAEADRVTGAHPERAEGWIWSGIVKSTYAGASGGLGALSLAKASKKDLERALAIDPQALQGSACTSLGTLYYSVPGWPVGFGDRHKAEELLQRALAIDPQGIDSNYFYGDFLLRQKRFDDARRHLLVAQRAPARAGREVADAGRQREIAAALARIEKETR
jgi:tetratricopeptide (TPR) repeat protein